MSNVHRDLTAKVKAVLSLTAIKEINFSFQGIWIRPLDYHDVKAQLEKKVKVRYVEGLMPAYFPDGNYLRLPFKDIVRPYHFCTVVHEVTHAVCDLEKQKRMTHDVSEAIAYLAESIFARNHFRGCRYEALLDKPTDQNSSLRKAWDLSKYYKIGYLSNNVSDARANELVKFVRHSGAYGHKAKQVVGYNG